MLEIQRGYHRLRCYYFHTATSAENVVIFIFMNVHTKRYRPGAGVAALYTMLLLGLIAAVMGIAYLTM